MSRIRIENDKLIIAMQGARKFFSLKSEVEVDLSNVTGVTTGLAWKDTPRVFSFEDGFDKVMGTDGNGFYFGGTFRQHGKMVFYDLKKREDAVVISINNEDFDTIIIGVEDAEATKELIENALKDRN